MAATPDACPLPDELPPLDPAALARDRAEGVLPPGRILDDGEIDALHAEERRVRLPRACGGARNPNLFVNVPPCHRSEPVRRHATVGGRPVLEDPDSWMVAGEAPG